MKPVQDSGHIRALDGIRGFALILVFAYHALLYEIEPVSRLNRLLRNLAGLGWAGVDLFFILSGFLITTILLEARDTENYFKVFYVRRALRILPLYYAVLGVSLLVMPGHYGFRQQVSYWLNLSNLSTAFYPFIIPYLAHFWSLGIEEQFYFLWPAVIRKLRATIVGVLSAGVVVLLFAARNLPIVMALNGRWPELVYRLTPFRIDTLCAGAALAVAVLRFEQLREYRLLFRVTFVISGCIFLKAAYGHLYMSRHVVRFGYTALIFSGVSLIALALFPGSLVSRVFSNGFLRKTGKYSYCFYLVHPFLVNYVAAHRPWADRHFHAVLGGWMSHNLISVCIAAVEFCIVFAFCAVSWNLFEGPILRLKKHFRYRPAPRQHLA